MNKSLRLLLFFLILILASQAWAGTTTVSATIVDSDSTVWANGTWSATLVPLGVGPSINGQTFTQTYSGTLNGSGAFSQVMADNTTVFPAGTQWKFVICPAPYITPSNTCGVAAIKISGTTQNISTQLNAAIIAPRLTGVVFPEAYVDSEVATTGLPSDSYIRQSDGTLRYWNGSAWVQISTGGGSGTVSSGTQGAPYINSSGGTIAVTSAQTVDASAFSGANWLAQVIAAANSTPCTNGCTVLIPPSLSTGGGYPSGALPTGVVYQFTGPAVFGVCSITSADPYFKMIGPATLQMDAAGSGCTALALTQTASSLESNDRSVISGLNVDCQSQAGASGITIGGAAQYWEHVSVKSCPVVDVKMVGTQFGLFNDLRVYNSSTVGLWMQQTSSGGGNNSNQFNELAATGNAVGVFNEAVGSLGNAPEYFIDFNGTSNGVAAMANYGNVGQDIHVIGGTTEGTGTGSYPGASITIDGHVITQAGFDINNNSRMYVENLYNADASITPWAIANNTSTIILTNDYGYGNSSGTIATTDSTSEVIYQGTFSYPAGATLCGGTGSCLQTFSSYNGGVSIWAFPTPVSLTNPTAATSGAAQSSPVFSVCGQYWLNAALSGPSCWNAQNVFSNGSNATSTLTFTESGSVSSYSITAGGSGCVAGALTIGAPHITGGVQATGTYACSGGALNSVTITNPGNGYTAAPSATIATGTGTLTLTISGITSNLLSAISFPQAGMTSGAANSSNTGWAVDNIGNVTFTGSTGVTTYSNFLFNNGSVIASQANGRLNVRGSSAALTRFSFGSEGSTVPAFCLAANVITICNGDGSLSSTLASAVPLPTPGTSITLAAPSGYAICTSTCTVTIPVPAAGYSFCIWNDDNVSTVITLAALGSSAYYENTARSAYGTAGTGTFVSGGAIGDKVCIVGRDATHYQTLSYQGAWTAN